MLWIHPSFSIGVSGNGRTVCPYLDQNHIPILSFPICNGLQISQDFGSSRHLFGLSRQTSLRSTYVDGMEGKHTRDFSCADTALLFPPASHAMLTSCSVARGRARPSRAEEGRREGAPPPAVATSAADGTPCLWHRSGAIVTRPAGVAPRTGRRAHTERALVGRQMDPAARSFLSS
ncbi:hypothetical protein B0H10DRAFT_2197051, partial [Mycena sp. CBHHK59/15]